jgi:hypothetical protein
MAQRTQLEQDLRDIFDSDNAMSEVPDAEWLPKVAREWLEARGHMRNLLTALQRAPSVPRTMAPMKEDLEKMFA